MRNAGGGNKMGRTHRKRWASHVSCVDVIDLLSKDRILQKKKREKVRKC